MKEVLVQIDTGYACGGIVLHDCVCVRACPIFKWAVGKHFDEIKNWGKIKRIQII